MRLATSVTFLTTFGLLGCERSNGTRTDTSSTMSAPPTVSVLVGATKPAPPMTSAEFVVDAGVVAAVVVDAGVVAALPTVIASVAGKTAGADAGKPNDGTSPNVALKPASKHASGKNYLLELASPGCKVASECAMTITLVATGDYHVNKEYPYKFVAAAAPNVDFLGKGGAMQFTRASGDFVEQGEKMGTLTVRFKASTPGDVHVAGTYKFSVCSAEQCQVEQEKIELTVPVT